MSIEQPEKSTSPATAVTSTGAQQEPTRLGDDPPISVDRSLLRLGAALGRLGLCCRSLRIGCIRIGSIRMIRRQCSANTPPRISGRRYTLVSSPEPCSSFWV
jgi:hypothetical protein